jgi:hypothetical protein
MSARSKGKSLAHRAAMPHLAEWADKARVGHWWQSGRDLPAWADAVHRLRDEGRDVKLRHAAGDDSGRGFAEARMVQGMRL